MPKFEPLIFSGITLFGGGGSGTTIGQPVGGADHNSVLIVDNSGNLQDVPLTNGQLVIGVTGSSPAAGTLTGTTNQVTVTTGSGTITLALPQDIATTSSPHFANLNLTPSGAIDVTSVGTLAIGTSNANVINIGNSGATVNIQGTTLYENVTQLQVKDPLITLNKGGGTGSASNSGVELEENGIITAYVETSADRNSWILKAPNAAGIATITPGASGITIAGNVSGNNTGDVTLTAVGSTPSANGASLSGQSLTLQPADGTNPGVITAGTQTIGGAKTFNGNLTAATTLLTTINDASGNKAIDVANKKLYDYTTSTNSVDWVNRVTLDTNGNTAINWANRRLFDVSGNESVLWTGRSLLDTSGNMALDWQGRNLIDSTGTTRLTWDTSGVTVNGDVTPANATFHLGNSTNYWNAVYTQNIFGPTGTGSISISNGQLKDSSSVVQLTFNTSGVLLNQLTANTALYLDGSNIIKSSATTSTELGYLSGVTSSVQTQLNSKVDKVTGDIAPSSYSVVNNSSQSITGLIFSAANVTSFEAFLNVTINGTVTTYTTVKLTGTRKSPSDWTINDLVVEYSGDAIPSFNNFTIQTSGQITISIGNVTGFTSGTIKFRARVI